MDTLCPTEVHNILLACSIAVPYHPPNRAADVLLCNSVHGRVLLQVSDGHCLGGRLLIQILHMHPLCNIFAQRVLCS